MKDIVIPAIEVIATIVIGIVVAVLLKRRDEKTKIKSLLIDHYMAYLKTCVLFSSNDAKRFFHMTLTDMCLHYEMYFGTNANAHFSKELLLDKKMAIARDLDSQDFENENWSYYTYLFTFLLKKKEYDRHLQPLESNILQEFIAERPRTIFLQKLQTFIRNDRNIIDGINSGNGLIRQQALKQMEVMIVKEHGRLFRLHFDPFSTMLADLINKY